MKYPAIEINDRIYRLLEERTYDKNQLDFIETIKTRVDLWNNFLGIVDCDSFISSIAIFNKESHVKAWLINGFENILTHHSFDFGNDLKNHEEIVWYIRQCKFNDELKKVLE